MEMRKYFPKSLNYFEKIKNIESKMKMRIKRRLDKALYNFICTFDYYPDCPDNINFDQIEFAKELERCVEDNFDYTIEKYGTIVPKRTGEPTIIYD